MLTILPLLVLCHWTRASQHSSTPVETIIMSKAEAREINHSTCECYQEPVGGEMECQCNGKEEIPQDLDSKMDKLFFINSEIEYISRDSLRNYREALKDINLANLPNLRVIEEATFRDIPNLRTLYITQAPKLKFVHGLLVGVTSRTFFTLRIVQTGLLEVPDLFHLPSDNIMHLVDLDANKIQRLHSNSINIVAEQLTINHNDIETVEDYAFNGSQIAKLNLRGNRRLTELKTDAFKGLRSLIELDLSETSIESLPVAGLSEIETLKIEKTPSLKVIPSIYDLENLKEAKLTHHFHCCAFMYPQQHNPERHALYQSRIKSVCMQDSSSVNTGQSRKRKRNIRSETEDEFWEEKTFLTQELLAYEPYADLHLGKSRLPFNATGVEDEVNPLRGRTIDHQEAKPIEHSQHDQGTFHAGSAEIARSHKVKAYCGNLSVRLVSVACTPVPDALNPCEDIMGVQWLRVSVWFVVVLAVVGNLAVITVVLLAGGELTVSRFLICNLAFADLCMGLYLLLIASMDVHSAGVYFNVAYDWQYGIGCRMAGFLTVFASHLSIFTLTLVTIERWFAITHAIHLTRRLRLRAAAWTMLGGWMYSALIAALPLLGVSNYSSASICLPMRVDNVVDKAYLYHLIISNGVAFGLIVFCYAQIYLSLGYETRHSTTRGEMTIAKKMALLIFTDFATFAPIAFFGLTALAGYPLIGVTRSKILLVFFYPLNACANPYLYAIMTSQYRRDFFILLARLGLCTKKARQYTITTTLPASNNSHPMPLLAKTNGKMQNSKTTEIDEV